MNHAATSLIAQASDVADHESFASLLLILGCAFLVAALIWLVIWLLLGSGDPANADTSTTTTAEKAAPDKAAAKLAADERALTEKAAAQQAAEEKIAADIATAKQAEAEAEKAAAKTAAAAAKKKTTNAKPSASGSKELPKIDTASKEEAAAAFSDELASGKARQEDVMGILYNEVPTEQDDLKLIKGVAKVLEGKLQAFDVYTFKQIAFWTDDAAREFGAKLSFRDRIFRDDWIAQAKTFHEEKYGEKL